ncbi:MAG: NifB/NifX family molybdenum-iron cluster-binding protein [Candidatus Krumholzibacteria bacterium]|nr:NifB/NifX family molybdenum-iron cluster-binding protein [Candidatus Krumholzibacteria bacterium]
MKVCIPAQDSSGLEGTPYGHFGSASYFVVYDTETGQTETVDNSDSHHEHGMCHPIGALGGREIDAVIVGGIGARAIMKLNAEGMRVYRAAPGTIRENVDLLTSGKLEELSVENACGGHGEGHGCGS